MFVLPFKYTKDAYNTNDDIPHNELYDYVSNAYNIYVYNHYNTR